MHPLEMECFLHSAVRGEFLIFSSICVTKSVSRTLITVGGARQSLLDPPFTSIAFQS
jgi:hypothetical protein